MEPNQESQELSVHAWAQTDVGKQRSHNEDNFIIDLKLGFFGVADGMGGHEAGEVASETALKIARKSLQTRIDKIRQLVAENPDKHRTRILELIDETVQSATNSVYSMSKRRAGSRGMGTTLSMMVVLGNIGVIAHVGDSRVYMLRQNQIFQLTEDHSLVGEQLRLGLISEEEAENSPYKNVITRAVGASETVNADTLFINLMEGDRFLICSDGLHGYFKEGEIGPHMAEERLDMIPQNLINLANERGGKDNITAVLLWAEGASSVEETAEAKVEITLRMDILQEIPLFKHLAYQELVKIMNITYLKTYTNGEHVFEENDEGDTVYVVLKGCIDIFRRGQLLASFVEGDHFGEMSLIDKSYRSGSARVKTQEAQLLTINRQHFIKLMRDEQAIAVKVLWGLLKSLNSRLRHTTEQLIR